ncbi:MAG: SGNH/GDSL hydrolase family protein [Paracoccaceae bacterium]|nr:SGNH/GDSL hydrolase family protein [Paracoccaceae bacterium]
MTARAILCFGDSNTHGTRAMTSSFDRRRLEPTARWTSIMGKALGPDFDVIAEGHPGRTTVFDDPIEGTHKNARRALQAILESHRPIDLVIMMLGTNDLKARFNVSAHDISLGVQRLIMEIHGNDSGPEGTAPAVLLAAPVPVIETGVFADTFAGAAEKSRALPALLEQIAARQDVAFADMGQHATVDPVDGIHLDATAHAAIGGVMAKSVLAFFKE